MTTGNGDRFIFIKAGRRWIWKSVQTRRDNLLCVAALLNNALIIKTVMHHPELDSL
ncbi:MAG: hypothetical protein WCY26_01985 [Thiohalobacteraceae bacterium]